MHTVCSGPAKEKEGEGKGVNIAKYTIYFYANVLMKPIPLYNDIHLINRKFRAGEAAQQQQQI